MCWVRYLSRGRNNPGSPFLCQMPDPSETTRPRQVSLTGLAGPLSEEGEDDPHRTDACRDSPAGAARGRGGTAEYPPHPPRRPGLLRPRLLLRPDLPHQPRPPAEKRPPLQAVLYLRSRLPPLP